MPDSLSSLTEFSTRSVDRVSDDEDGSRLRLAMINPEELFPCIVNRSGEVVGEETEDVAEWNEEIAVYPLPGSSNRLFAPRGSSCRQ